MNRRQKFKYLKHRVPCAHEEEDMAYYGDIETFAKQAKKVRLTALVMDARCINHHIQ